MEETKETQLNIREFWQRLWKLITPSHKEIKVLVGFTLLLEFGELIGPYILKMIIDLLSELSRANLEYIALLAAGLLMVNQSVAMFAYFANLRIVKVLVDMENYVSINAFNKMLELSLGYHEKENTGNKISKIQRGIDKMSNLLQTVLWEVGPTFIQAIFTTGFLFWINWRLGLVFLFFVPLFVYLTLRANRKVYAYRKLLHDKYEEAGGKMAQAVININTVKSFVQEKREEKEYSGITAEIIKNEFLQTGIIFKYNWLRSVVIDVGRASIILLGAVMAYKGMITIGSLVFAVTISEKALISLFRISRFYDRVMDSSEAVDRLVMLSLEESEISNKKSGFKPKKIEGIIEFKDLSFAYSENGNKALDGVNLKINCGSTTALVGPSGGGKTTLARLIYRHYDPQTGGVYLDDRNLKDYDLYALRRFIAIVPQEVEIFDGNIMNNIAYANPAASRQEIEAAARIANVEEFVLKLPKGYDTEVGERGIKLSGGQRQRVGIARAILANPRILIFDEATSSLDSYSEKLIQEAMDKVVKNRTTIIIAHRLSTIRKADKIVVLEDGKVKEEGPHYELARNKGGLYAKLLKLQETGDIE